MNIDEVLRIARLHVGDNLAGEASARLCLETAIQMYDYGQFESAENWAIRSLKHSVGIFHPDYKRVLDGGV